eukprot:COSAG01_NODE_4692_length_4808_cov_9.520493_7_plen_84_part_00
MRVEIMGSQKCRIVGKSQSVLLMINPMIFTRTRGRRMGAAGFTVTGRVVHAQSWLRFLPCLSLCFHGLLSLCVATQNAIFIWS